MRLGAFVALSIGVLTVTPAIAAENKTPKVTLSFSWETNQMRTAQPGLNEGLNYGGDFWHQLVATTRSEWSGPLGWGLAAGTSDPSGYVLMWGTERGPSNGTTLDIFNGRSVRYGQRGVPFRADIGLLLGRNVRFMMGYAQSRTSTVTQESFRDYLFVDGTEHEQVWCHNDRMCPSWPQYIPVTTVNLSRRYTSSTGTVAVRTRSLSLGVEDLVDNGSNVNVTFAGGVDLQLFQADDSTVTRDYVYSVFMPEGIKDFHPGAREDPAMYRDEVANADRRQPGSSSELHALPYVGLGLEWRVVKHLSIDARVRYYPWTAIQSYTAESALGPYGVTSSSRHITFSAGTSLGF